jgi:hypothetical protein
MKLRRPPATLWQPFGLSESECPNSSPSPHPMGRELPECRVSLFEPVNIQQPTSNIEHPMTAILRSTGCWMLVVGCFGRVAEGRVRGSTDSHPQIRPSGWLYRHSNPMLR